MAEAASAGVSSNRSPVRVTAWLCLAYALVVLLVYRDTVGSIIGTWDRSETYTHGYLIVPIFLWLLWNKRGELAACVPRPVLWVQLMLLPGGLVWLVSSLTDVLVVQQLALVGILIVGIWSIIGHRMARRLAFPLGFLFLGVPMGEDLVPPMMEFTATSTVWLVKMTGIPVYREGLYFTLPSGHWSVVEACSGVRYLIASFTLGLLYAHLTYRTLRKQLLFVLASILVPVLANTARAYIIVMLGHLSGMTIATGIDHLIYGWLFFGLVMLVLFWIGAIWQDPHEEPGDEPGAVAVERAAASPVPAFVLALVLAASWPLFAAGIEPAPVGGAGEKLAVPPPAGWRAAPTAAWEWQPIDRGAYAAALQFYQRDGQTVALYLQQYIRQRGGAELVTGKTNQFIDQEQAWHIAGHGKVTAELAGAERELGEVRLSDGKQRLLLWHGYRIGARYTSRPYVAKLYEALEALSFGRRDSAMILLVTAIEPGDGGQAAARERLQAFLGEQLPAVEASLDASAP